MYKCLNGLAQIFLAYVASVPVRNIGPREGIFAFRTCSRPIFPSSFLFSPYFPRVLNAKIPSRGPSFRSARTGTLATQAKIFLTELLCYSNCPRLLRSSSQKVLAVPRSRLKTYGHGFFFRSRSKVMESIAS